MKLFFYFLFSNFIVYTNSFIYKVKSLSYLQKSLRQLSSDVSFLHYINGDSRYLNYYYTTLYLGKNKSPQVYILDTGSSITTSPCDQCTSCGEHLNPKYPLENTSKILSCDDSKCKMAPSSRCSLHKCSFYISYAEGSRLSGIYVDQDIYFEAINMEPNITNQSYNIPIGCTTTETHLFKTQLADGIMGLNNNDNSFVSMMYKLDIIQKNIFSLCFEHDGGYFSIGKIYDEYHYSKDIKYVNLINKDFGNYKINFKYLKIGNDKVDFNGEAVIDSGTTISYFPTLKFKEIMKIILDKCEISKKCGNLRKVTNFGYCVQVKDEKELNKIVNEGWGNITFNFGDYEFNWTPKNYHYTYAPSKKDINVCLGFDEDRRTNTLLGTTFMHGFDIIFDKEEHRLGFVEADCNREIANNKKINITNENDMNKEINDKINVTNGVNNDKINVTNEVNVTNEIVTDINKNVAIDIPNDNISINEVINKTTITTTYIKEINNVINITNIINNVSEIKENKVQKNTKNFDNFMVIMCYSILSIILVIFIIFNIILCWDNYSVIQGRKDDEDIDKFVLENFKYDNTSNGPISLFNDSI